mmetsp:Transcript_15657/g.42036  ORF Transcript_15657/g.42036 Transcript_15657/m.42036 type:complete len:246 (-) Transcript_15657:433-1170(-)
MDGEEGGESPESYKVRDQGGATKHSVLHASVHCRKVRERDGDRNLPEICLEGILAEIGEDRVPHGPGEQGALCALAAGGQEEETDEGLHPHGEDGLKAAAVVETCVVKVRHARAQHPHTHEGAVCEPAPPFPVWRHIAVEEDLGDGHAHEEISKAEEGVVLQSMLLVAGDGPPRAAERPRGYPQDDQLKLRPQGRSHQDSARPFLEERAQAILEEGVEEPQVGESGDGPRGSVQEEGPGWVRDGL